MWSELLYFFYCSAKIDVGIILGENVYSENSDCKSRGYGDNGENERGGR